MRIKKLELFGFKSFAERQILHFDSGITGIVGPNGCGKSNIVDALLWVMGEHNAKHLRGNNMQDVIFNGSQNRSPLGFAEVVLTLENDGKNVPPEYEHFHEIEITRRLYRAGDSEFEINRRTCRLKDITDLFLGTGVGSRAYSIIEQGRVGQIISAKPEDRRHIIDEAAGITKYKSKRAAAERKIEETTVNLSRINDIVKELESRLSSLDKQAKKARRYKALKEEIKAKDFHHASLRWLEIRSQERFVSSAITEASEAVLALEDLLKQRQEAVDEGRSALKEQEDALSLSQKLYYEAKNTLALSHKDLAFLEKDLEEKKRQDRFVQDEINRTVQRGEDSSLRKVDIAAQIVAAEDLLDEASAAADVASRELASLHERYQRQKELTQLVQSKSQSAATDAATRQIELTNWQEKLDVATNRRKNLALEKVQIEESLVAAREKIELLAGEIAAGKAKKESNDQVIHDANFELDRVTGQLKEAKIVSEETNRAISQKSSRLTSLEEIDGSYEWSESKLGQFLEGQPKTAILGILADYIDVPSDIEGATEIALKQWLETVLVADLGHLADMCEQLTSQDLGRIRLFPQPKGEAKLDFSQTVGISLFDFVRAGAEELPLRHILQRIILVDSSRDALESWEWAKDNRCILLSRDGSVFGDDGSVTSGKPLKASGLLKRKREMRELSAELTILNETQEAQNSTLEKLLAQADDLRKTIESLYQENRSISQGISSLHESLGARTGSLRALEQKQENFSQEEREIDNLLARAQEESVSRSEQWTAALERHETILEDLEDARVQLAEIERDVAVQNESTTALKVRLAEIGGKLSNFRDSERRLSEDMLEFAHRLENLKRQSSDLAQAQTEGSDRLVILSQQIEGASRESAVTEERVNRQKMEHAQIAEKVSRVEAEVDASRAILRTQENGLSELKLALQSYRQSLQNLDDRMYEKYRILVQEFVSDYHMLDVPAEELDRDLQALRRTLENLGSVNPHAEEEFEELNGRYVFLKAQGDDLGLALEQLQEAIVKINKATSKCFAESFEAINARFSQVFPRLFNGGRAWLALTNPEDLLNTGVEIFAEPPGKKLGSIALMSGGEKALTATSLIFAIFLIKPSPFCLLDEVDAPLDEANVQRFGQLVHEISAVSQFIVITHNKKTMEGAQKLYGITMETPGVSKTVSVNLSHRKNAIPAETELLQP